MERGAGRVTARLGARQKYAADSPTHASATDVVSYTAAVINDCVDC
jgi:hypothetical protein